MCNSLSARSDYIRRVSRRLNKHNAQCSFQKVKCARRPSLRSSQSEVTVVNKRSTRREV